MSASKYSPTPQPNVAHPALALRSTPPNPAPLAPTPPHRSPNQRLRARILYVDPAAKRVGLTLQRHLLAFSLPPNFPMLGQVGRPCICC